MNQGLGAAAKLLAHQAHGKSIRGVEADMEAPRRLPVADVRAMTERLSAEWTAPRKCPNSWTSISSRSGSAIWRPHSRMRMCGRKGPRAAHVLIATQRLVLAGEADRQPRRGRVDRPLELRDELLTSRVLSSECQAPTDTASKRTWQYR